MTAADVYSPGH